MSLQFNLITIVYNEFMCWKPINIALLCYYISTVVYLAEQCMYLFTYLFYHYIYPPDSQESNEGANT